MKVIIPMAGYGTRLRPHTWSKPKPLVAVAGKPVLGHVLDTVAGLPFVEEVIFIVGYLGQQVEEYVHQAYPRLQARFIEQRDLLGQSHAIWLARDGLAGPMLMIFVDTLVEVDLTQLGREQTGAVAFVKAVPDPRRFGVAELGAQGRVTRLVEKPQDAANNLAVVGLYYFADASALLQAIEAQMRRGSQLRGEYFLADAINILLDGGLEMRVEPVEVWMDCGTPESLLETNRFLLDHGRDNSLEAARRPQVLVIPPVFIDPTAELHQAVIGPHVTVAAGCIIERSILQDSIVDAGSSILDTTLAQSLIGRDARVVGRHRSLNVGDSSEVGFA